MRNQRYSLTPTHYSLPTHTWLETHSSSAGSRDTQSTRKLVLQARSRSSPLVRTIAADSAAVEVATCDFSVRAAFAFGNSPAMATFLVLKNLPGNPIPMPLTDPIGDLLTRIRNAQHGRRTECRAPWSKMKEGICQLLKTHGYIAEIATEGEGTQKEIVVTFLTSRPPLELKRVSTPGGRTYVGAGEIRALLHGNAMAIISTSNGLLTDTEARAKNLGGEFLCTIS